MNSAAGLKHATETRRGRMAGRTLDFHLCVIFDIFRCADDTVLVTKGSVLQRP
jgi:hypothetical protein